MKWTVFLVPIGLFWYGWSAQTENFWLFPIMGTALIGAGAFCTFVSQFEYILVVDLLTSLVDAYADSPRRLLWQICRLCPCRRHGITLNFRLYPSSRWANDVFKIWSWLGELASRFCRAGLQPSPFCFLYLRRTDPTTLRN
jgi:hypothetical protein